MIEGCITKISGPIIRASGMRNAGLYDVVEAGESRVMGEIIRLEGDIAVIQIYEDNTGMRIGERVVSLGAPLSVEVGPGLIGSIFDGIQRPLKILHAEHGAFLPAGAKARALDPGRTWEFRPKVAEGDDVGAGTILGEVAETESVLHRVILPPGTPPCKVVSVAAPGAYTIDETVAELSTGERVAMSRRWPVRNPRPFSEKLRLSEPLVTGLRVIDVLFPIAKGGTAAVPGGFGTGKTMTQHAIAKWCDAEVIVYIGCGERGNEMTDVLTEFPKLIDPRTGQSLMGRTILIANTSNMPVAAREVSIYTGITLAEYYRDMGYNVAIMADSTSRWAEALRELSGRLEEMPAEEGFPAYLPTRLAEFYERAGMVKTQSGARGSVTVIGAVSPPGGDFSEPVTQHTKRFIRCFWALDRELANARHYPAIGWIESYSEYAQEVEEYWEGVNADWKKARAEALDLLKTEQKLQEIVRLIGPDALPDEKRLVLLVADMVKNGFLQQNSFDPVDMYCVPEKETGILVLVMEFHRRSLALVRRGAPLVKISSLPVRERISRARSQVKNENARELHEIAAELDAQCRELEAQYREGSAK